MKISVTPVAARAGRIASRYAERPDGAAASTASAAAPSGGMPLAASDAAVIAPIMANSPWAKLISPVTW